MPVIDAPSTTLTVPATVEELRRQIEEEERVVGIRSDTPLSDKEIHRRRRQISLVALLVFFGLVVTTLRSDLWDASEHALIDPNLLKSVMITFTGGFIAYVVEKEKHLRRLHALGGRARSVQLETAERILETAAFSATSVDLHDSLLLEDVLTRLLDGALELTGAPAGALHLPGEGPDGAAALTTWSRRGLAVDPAGREPGVAARVAQSRRPLLVSASGVRVVSDGATMAVPVLVRGTLAAVLEVRADPRYPFDAVDLEVLARYAERGAGALANACRYEDALLDADRHSS